MIIVEKGIVVGIECDACRKRGDSGRSPVVMRRELAKLSWTQIDEKDFCGCTKAPV